MGKTIIRLTEEDLHRIIQESVNEALNEANAFQNGLGAMALGASMMSPMNAQAQNTNTQAYKMTHPSFEQVHDILVKQGKNNEGVFEILRRYLRMQMIGNIIGIPKIGNGAYIFTSAEKNKINKVYNQLADNRQIGFYAQYDIDGFIVILPNGDLEEMQEKYPNVFNNRLYN